VLYNIINKHNLNPQWLQLRGPLPGAGHIPALVGGAAGGDDVADVVSPLKCYPLSSG